MLQLGRGSAFQDWPLLGRGTLSPCFLPSFHHYGLRQKSARIPSLVVHGDQCGIMHATFGQVSLKAVAGESALLAANNIQVQSCSR